ncbi:EAL domain-containing protein [Brevibacillus fluminis]|uniref:EAL domain-containing protein n=1 Tax=Brevibacillus fluminis TaxID=511487 RepID=A0A3M8DA57_9BACL|nr:EAL domain-containing protein [Brevibacillus fluminis]RNB84451.1 EAL domain-containing protein [Brevibacillus fluminis]
MLYFSLLSVIAGLTLYHFYYRGKTEKQLEGLRNEPSATAEMKMVMKIIEESPCMISVKDWDGYYTLANKRYAAEYNQTPEAMIGRNVRDFRRHDFNDQLQLEEDREIMSSQQKVEYEVAYTDKSDQQRWVRVIKIPFLENASRHVLSMAVDITECKQIEAMVDYQSRNDSLTGLPNRLFFFDRAAAAIDESKSVQSTFAVLVLDLDRFKIINDMLGHGIGDQLLQSVAVRLSNLFVNAGTVARVSGDTFAVLVPHCTELEAAEWAERVIALFAGPFPLAKHELYITPSIGISMYPQDGADAETLIKHADTGMYLAKELGKNTFQFYRADKSAAATRQFMLEGYLRKALAKNEFELYYQPKMNIKTGELIGMEALLRWNHPELGMVSPADFIPLAEETGLIVPIGEWVIQTACLQNKKWQDEGFLPLKVSVNLSARQFQHNLVDKVSLALTFSGLAPHWLELEITESILMQNEETIISILDDLKQMGVLISIDDFGTGYCSLSYLKHFPLDTLKIAQPFVRDLSKGTVDSAIATALITLGHSLGLNVIAEGVETTGQLRILQDQQCDEIQGYILSKPLSSHDFARWLNTEASKGPELVT